MSKRTNGRKVRRTEAGWAPRHATRSMSTARLAAQLLAPVGGSAGRRIKRRAYQMRGAA